MKKFLVFVLGFVSGIVFALGLLFIVSSVIDKHDVNFFEQPGECLISKSSLKVFQVIEPNVALAVINGEWASGVYLLVNSEGKMYYDAQIIKLPAGKCCKQIGTYKYPTKDDSLKTVPVVKIM